MDIYEIFLSGKIYFDIHSFPTLHVAETHFLLEICEYQSHPRVEWKNSNVAQLSLI